MNTNFRKKLIKDYQDDLAWKRMLSILRKLKTSIVEEFTFNRSDSVIEKSQLASLKISSSKVMKNSKIFEVVLSRSLIDIDFSLKNDLIYHVKNEKKRLCILKNIEANVIKAIHDDCFHVSHHCAYVRLFEIVYVHKLSRKLIIYIRHCFSCQLNQIKRHRDYDELIFVFTFFISFHIIAMDFVLALSKNNSKRYDCVLNITNKFFRRVLSIVEKSIYVAIDWIERVLDRL